MKPKVCPTCKEKSLHYIANRYSQKDSQIMEYWLCARCNTKVYK